MKFKFPGNREKTKTVRDYASLPRRKIKSPAGGLFFKVPKQETLDLKAIAKTLFQHPSDIPKVIKTKKFIMARLEGKTIKDANKEAGFPEGKLQEQSLASPIAVMLLEELVQKYIPDVDVAVRLKEMWDARKIIVTQDKKGNQQELDLGPDKDLQKYAMDKRLIIGGVGKVKEELGTKFVTQIQFTTVGKTEEVVEVTSE